ncbi:hypothetical protein TPL01_21580 [Sulfuriferula plumbiphila]|uniref:HMA domain-containing protein n=1 Tax=Sulfuriferula plumbiphila TaxID=171865 RepID=A0A512L972_9PROT|nr:heavy metal-associated domain-containing protein [Sulfuriferula plumbiphila]BBP04363.1 hypothetical protein SFPGR_17850 [Sulfuriferula plumbiphila]GEP31020.1 hypothetical protein TPL01_21580 [Sulfuriferula plumbiphila]
MDRMIEFLVADQRIHCSGCETWIAAGLQQLPGVLDVRASAETRHALVSLGGAGTIGAGEIGEKREKLGYEENSAMKRR